MTLFYGVLDPRSGELAWCNAGHNPPFLVRRKGDIVPLDGGGPVLGVVPAMCYEEQRGSMEPGDVLVLYSDGVTEACDPAGVEFEDRLKSLIVERRADAAAGIVKAVHEAVGAWIAGQPPADDVTVVAARLS